MRRAVMVLLLGGVLAVAGCATEHKMLGGKGAYRTIGTPMGGYTGGTGQYGSVPVPVNGSASLEHYENVQVNADGKVVGTGDTNVTRISYSTCGCEQGETVTPPVEAPGGPE